MEENTFLNANNLYEDVEGESGKTLSLEEDQQRNLIGIKGRYAQAEMLEINEKKWIQAYKTTGFVCKNVKFREV